MADVRIDDATEDLEATGIENVPVSDAGVGKRLSVARIKDYIFTQLVAVDAASATDVSTDGVYVLQGGSIKRLPENTLADAVINYGFTKVGVVTADGNEVFVIDDAGTKKTITLSAIRTFVQSDMSGLFTGLSTLESAIGTDEIIVKSGSSVKKATMAQVATYAEGCLGAWINGLTEAGALTGSEKLLVTVNGVSRSVTVSALLASIGGGNVLGPSTTTEGKVPRWGATNKTLADGMTVRETVRAVGTADNSSLATEAAVRAAVDAVNEGVTVSGTTPTNGNIPVFSGAKTIADGKSVQTTIRNDLTASDGAIPTEKAVRDAIIATADGKVDKVTGKGLSTEDYTTAEKAKLAGVATGADMNVQSDWNQTNTAADDFIKNKPTIPAESKIADWSSSKAYAVGDYCLHGGFLRRCIVAGQVSSFRSSDWEYIPAYPNDNTKFLRGDGTWAIIPSDTDFTGATSEAAGKHGLVPAPAVSDLGKFLKGDGTWSEVAHGDVTGPATTTENKVPQWDATSKNLKDGLAVVTTFGATTTDTNIPTEKAVADRIDAEKSLALSSNGTGLSGTVATLSNRTSHRFSMTAGTNYTFVLPAAVSGKMREFYVAFDFTGSAGSITKITFSNGSAQVSVITSSGLSSTMNVVKVGSTVEYHAYHFFEEDGNIVCENVFAAAEEVQPSATEITRDDVQATEGQTISVTNGKLARIDAATNSPSTFVVNFAASSVGKLYRVELFVICGATLSTTITLNVGGAAAQSVMYEGNYTSLVSMLEAGKAVWISVMVDYNSLVVCKNGTFSVS